MEYCSDDLANLNKETGPIKRETCSVISLWIACAVSYIHSHYLAHLDIKPQNILLSSLGLQNGLVLDQLCTLGNWMELAGFWITALEHSATLHLRCLISNLSFIWPGRICGAWAPHSSKCWLGDTLFGMNWKKHFSPSSWVVISTFPRVVSTERL